MKKWLIWLMACSIMLSLAGCVGGNQTEETGSTNAHTAAAVPIPTVMINGTCYHDWSISGWDVEIEENEILGYITSVTGEEQPQKDNEANYSGALNMPYARWTDEEYGEVYVIKRNLVWYILLPVGTSVGA